MPKKEKKAKQPSAVKKAEQNDAGENYSSQNETQETEKRIYKDFFVTIQGIKLEARPLLMRHLKTIRDIFLSVASEINESMSALEVVMVLIEAEKFEEFFQLIFTDQPQAKNINVSEMELNEMAEVTDKFFLLNEKVIKILTRLFGNLDLNEVMN